MKHPALVFAAVVSLFPALAGAAISKADVIVYGATPAGICAAIGAAREGADVLLVEPTGRALACIGVNHPRATPVDPFPSARRVSQHRWTTRDSPGAGQDEGTGEQGA